MYHNSENECAVPVRNASPGQAGCLICNPRLVDNERELVEEFAQKLNSRLLYFIPRDNLVQHAELQRKTVIELAPDSAQADECRALASALDQNTFFSVPTPISNDGLESLLLKYCPIG